MRIDELSDEDIRWYAENFHVYACVCPLDDLIFAGRKIILHGKDIEGLAHEDLTTLRKVAYFLDQRSISYNHPHNEAIEELLHPNGHSQNLSNYFG